MKPISLPLMLAHNYNPKRIIYPCYLQPKLDGIRARFYRGKFYSRDDKIWRDNLVKHILEVLNPYIELMPSDIMLDGEFYAHGMPLGDHVSAINVNNKEPNSLTPHIKFLIFDFCRVEEKNLPFCSRLEILKQNRLPNLVPSYLVLNEEEGDKLYEELVAQGFEGAMYKMANLPYIDNRTYRMLKRKKFQMEEFLVIDYVEGLGKCRGMLGALVCTTKEGKMFNVGGGFTDEQRIYYYNNPKEILQRYITVKFQQYSKDKIPVGNTVFVCVRNYE